MKNKYPIEKRIADIKKTFCDNEDLIVRNFEIGEIKLALVFLDEMSNQEEINKNILTPLLSSKEKIDEKDVLNTLTSTLVPYCNLQQCSEEESIELILRGFTALYIDGVEKLVLFNTTKFETRGVEEPPTSTVISGPREGFNENIKINLSLIRRRLLSTKLKIDDMLVGTRTKTKVSLVYFKDIADKRVVDEIKRKLSSFEVDGVLDSHYLTNFLEDRPNSIFRQVGNSEKPDIVCSKILEGRVAILVDGSPIVLTVPFIIFEDFQSANDYYSNSHRVAMLRIIRLIGIFIAVFLPGMYIAMQLYHYKILPLKFLVTIVSTTQNLPLNPFLEILFIIVLFDILFEASVRMPKYLGMAISIVGALILGDTAVKAGLVSPPGVMIVALSAMTVYIIPNQSPQISIMRLMFAVIGGTLGFHGLILSFIYLVSYLSNFDSFGSPYLAPFAPKIDADVKDFVFKEGLIRMKTRPHSIPHKNDVRLKIKSKGEKIK